MQSLRDIDLPAAIDTSRYDITREFFAPLLSCATRYDRGVGFFSSGWLKINAVGMAAFAATSTVLANRLTGEFHAKSL